MPNVKFTVAVSDGNGNTFRSGRTYELDKAEADHWVGLGYAEHDAEPKKTAAKKAAAKPAAKETHVSEPTKEPKKAPAKRTAKKAAKKTATKRAPAQADKG